MHLIGKEFLTISRYQKDFYFTHHMNIPVDTDLIYKLK